MLLLVFKNNLSQNKDSIPILYLGFFGSFIFLFSGAYWSHIFSAFLLIWSFDLFKNEHFLYAGLAMGACFMNEYNLCIFGVIWGLYLLFQRQWKSLILFSLGSLPFIILQGIYNYSLTNSFFELAYRYQANFQQNADSYGFTFPSLTALLHLSISPYRGILFYAPILVIFIYFIWKNKADIFKNPLNKVVIISCIIYFIIFTCNKSWYGGWTYGPRYLLGIAALLFYVFANEIQLITKKSKVIFYSLVSFGIVDTFLAKATILYPRTELKIPLLEGMIPAVIKGKFNDGNLLGFLGIQGAMPHLLFLVIFLLVVYLLHKKSSTNNGHFLSLQQGMSKDGRSKSQNT